MTYPVPNVITEFSSHQIEIIESIDEHNNVKLLTLLPPFIFPNGYID